MLIDAVIGLFLLAGIGLGAWRGLTKATIIFLATYIPGLIFIYYYDEISNFVRVILEQSSNANTAFLGGIGVFSGLLAIIGFSGGVFLFTRLLLSLLSLHTPDLHGRILGACAGFIIQNISATLLFFLIYTALPVETSKLMHKSIWAQLLRPMHQITYPTYLAYMKDRTSRLSASLATNGLGKTLVNGVSFNDLKQVISLPQDSDNIQGLVDQVKSLSQTVDLTEISELLSNFDSDTLSAEAIDERIALENAKRLEALNF